MKYILAAAISLIIFIAFAAMPANADSLPQSAVINNRLVSASSDLPILMPTLPTADSQNNPAAPQTNPDNLVPPGIIFEQPNTSPAPFVPVVPKPAPVLETVPSSAADSTVTAPILRLSPKQDGPSDFVVPDLSPDKPAAAANPAVTSDAKPKSKKSSSPAPPASSKSSSASGLTSPAVSGENISPKAGSNPQDRNALVTPSVQDHATSSAALYNKPQESKIPRPLKIAAEALLSAGVIFATGLYRLLIKV